MRPHVDELETRAGAEAADDEPGAVRDLRQILGALGAADELQFRAGGAGGIGSGNLHASGGREAQEQAAQGQK
jgi:hypothetical protein